MIKESKHCVLLKDLTGFNLNLLKCIYKSDDPMEDNEEQKDEDSPEEEEDE